MELRELTDTPYPIFFRNRTEMSAWLEARGFRNRDMFEREESNCNEWEKTVKNKMKLLRVSDNIFDDDDLPF